MNFESQKPIFIAGPCVIESADVLDVVAAELVRLRDELGVQIVFKASFDKANRTSLSSYRGPGLDKGLQMLADVKAKWASFCQYLFSILKKNKKINNFRQYSAKFLCACTHFARARLAMKEKKNGIPADFAKYTARIFFVLALRATAMSQEQTAQTKEYYPRKDHISKHQQTKQTTARFFPCLLRRNEGKTDTRENEDCKKNQHPRIVYARHTTKKNKSQHVCADTY